MPRRSVWLLVMYLPATTLATQPATLKQDGPLLATPSLDAAVVTELKAPAPLTVLQREGGWYQVTPKASSATAATAATAASSGWLRLFHVQFVKGRYQPDNLPLSDLTGLIQSNFQQVTSSTGVRGLDKVAITDASPNFANLAALHNYQQNAAQALAFATAGQLRGDPNILLEEQQP